MRDILTSPRITEIKHNRRVRKFRLIIFLGFIFITSIGALAYFSANSHITINKIVITGNLTINTDDIESRVNSILSGRYMHLFARSNTFIYPRKQIYKDLITFFPRIETLSIYRDNFNTLHILITEQIVSSLYCGKQIPTSEDIGDNCYFINNDGFIFDKAPYFSGNVYFKYYLNISNNDNPISQQILTPEHFHNVSNFINGITSLGFKPIYLVIDNDIYTLYLDHNSKDTSPTIIFNNDNDLSVILNNLSTAMTKSEFTNDINSQYNKLLYIDLRFNNKVLYKFN